MASRRGKTAVGLQSATTSFTPTTSG
ncbi:unnamed protein product [Linum tenue]|uniref:Ribulose-1,5-bisphosphate carboxylase/oxygenase large subunit n=1 Tax=Linum tenue TaxID=586396 RepID=A0AAV0KY73_9ROSI|nr:unnamed protein product [Linum tenue]CAI0426285.1 unnamed protein product [Linum tenue]